MATYIKFRELTKPFNFSKKKDTNNLPKYVLDYVEENETVYAAYETTRDQAIFTDRRVILFDKVSVFSVKKVIHIIPYSSISTGAISFAQSYVQILITLDSGYQTKWKFSNMTPEDKTCIRRLYSYIMKKPGK